METQLVLILEQAQGGCQTSLSVTQTPTLPTSPIALLPLAALLHPPAFAPPFPPHPSPSPLLSPPALVRKPTSLPLHPSE